MPRTHGPGRKEAIEMTQEYTLTELMVVAAARELEDGKGILVGTGMPLAAALLAKRTHTPDLMLVFEAGAVGPIKMPRLPISVGEAITCHRAVQASSMDDVMGAAARGMIEYGFLGGAQIDMYGNLNTTVIGDYNTPKVRFPGSGGANDIGSLCRKTIVIMKHEKHRFMPKNDFITTPGYLDGPGGRERAGLPEGGPYKVVSTLGVMGFDPESKRMRIDKTYPTSTIELIKENTGFELLLADKVTQVKPPTKKELTILRTKVDPLGHVAGLKSKK